MVKKEILLSLYIAPEHIQADQEIYRMTSLSQNFGFSKILLRNSNLRVVEQSQQKSPWQYPKAL